MRRSKKDFFEKDPEITDGWLLNDAASYEAFVIKRLGKKPNTPFGFYIPSQHRMVMNLSTGSGTLIHELVHPFIASNFPKCPPWLNEGLASLYEGSTVRDDHLIGLINWRLPELQLHIRNGTATPLRAIMAMSSDQFAEDPQGDYYAASRYLLYYLQERGLLMRYYKAFHARAARSHRVRRAEPRRGRGVARDGGHGS